MSPLVCVVDDDTSLLRALGRLIRTAGFTVEMFSSAEDFLLAAHRLRPRCLVLDVRLGGMTGFQLYGELRAQGAAPPVIFITAHDDAETRESARRAGAIQYLRKPFDDGALIDALSRAAAVSAR